MKKLITLVLVFLMTVSALAFTLMGVSAKVIEGDSPNLLLNYNPSFEDGIYPWMGRGISAIEQFTEDSQDGDDASCLVLDRKTYAYSNIGIDLPEIANDQGDGEYEFSIWVKAEKKNQTMKLKAAAQIEYQNDNPRVLGKTTLGKVVEVTNEWTQLKM